MNDLDLEYENASLHTRVQELEDLLDVYRDSLVLLDRMIEASNDDLEAQFAEVFEAGFMVGRGPAGPLPAPHWIDLHNPYKHKHSED